MSLRQSEPVALPDRPLGRQMRSIAAHALLTTMMIVTELLVFIPAALFHCALRNGRRAAWATAAVAFGVASLYAAAIPSTQPDAVKLFWAGLLSIGLTVALPALAALPLVEQGAKFGRLVALLLLGSVAGMVATEALSRSVLSISPYTLQVAQSKVNNAQFVQFYRTNGAPPEALRMMERWATYSTTLLPAVMLVLLTLIFVLSLLMLGRLKAWREHAARRGDGDALGVYLFRNFALPEWVLFAFVLGGVAPLASGLLHQVAANTLFIVAFLYFLQGLAIFRFVLLAMGAGFAGTMLGWLLLVFLTLTGVGPVLLALAGLFDPFFDFRNFKKRKDDSHESHSD
ncbi:MAG TPA: DUF2232 domain-containing protein [Thermoanaerobaculia bacterium]|nr:DUF2232 domain-containing protein [Thermoanaerobaculia bacterium]